MRLIDTPSGRGSVRLPESRHGIDRQMSGRLQRVFRSGVQTQIRWYVFCHGKSLAAIVIVFGGNPRPNRIQRSSSRCSPSTPKIDRPCRINPVNKNATGTGKVNQDRRSSDTMVTAVSIGYLNHLFRTRSLSNANADRLLVKSPAFNPTFARTSNGNVFITTNADPFAGLDARDSARWRHPKC